MGLVNYGDAALEQCEICPARTSTVSAFSGKSQVDLSFSGNLIALHTNSPLLILVRSMYPREVWDACRGTLIGFFCRPTCIQMDEGGERGNEALVDFRSERRIKLQFQGARAYSWVLESRKGFARRIYRSSAPDNRPLSRVLQKSNGARVPL